MRLKNKVAIITAAGSGVGRAGALLFAREGAKVVVGDVNSRTGEETVTMVKDRGGDAAFVAIDAGNVDDMQRLIGTSVEIFGGVNILWNHAGTPGPGIIESTEEAEFDKAMNLNVKGGFFATKYAIPHMKEAGSGSIIFTASIAALRASPFSPFYALAKGGLVPLTMSLAVYLGPYNIRVNCICPGGIDTPMLRVFVNRSGSAEEGFVARGIEDLAKRSPMGRLATAEDVANAALFLASDEASYINGVILPVDGGAIAKYWARRGQWFKDSAADGGIAAEAKVDLFWNKTKAMGETFGKQINEELYKEMKTLQGVM